MIQFHGLRGKMGNFRILPASDWPTGFLSRLKESQLAHFSSGVLCSFLSTHLALCPMEVNKEEAIRCLSIAKNHFGTGNYTSAVKLTKKSISLFPTDEAKAFLVKAEAKVQSEASATASGSNATSSPSTENIKRREHKTQTREYTQEQIEAVKRISACGTDYYKILGLEKTCTDGEIKKSYRKVELYFCLELMRNYGDLKQ